MAEYIVHKHIVYKHIVCHGTQLLFKTRLEWTNSKVGTVYNCCFYYYLLHAIYYSNNSCANFMSFVSLHSLFSYNEIRISTCSVVIANCKRKSFQSDKRTPYLGLFYSDDHTLSLKYLIILFFTSHSRY